MRSPPGYTLDNGVVAGRLDGLARTVRAGGLSSLLKGEGLDRGTVEELLRPESLSALKAILTEHLSKTKER